MDTISPESRSRVMAAVKARGNRSTEKVLRAHLARSGIRGWRMHAKDLAGCPDFVFDQSRIAIFVDGCFWHGCPQHLRKPSSNTKYWEAKIARNMKRDKRNRAALRQLGWRVIRVWEHELKCPAKVVAKIKRAITTET